MFSVSVESKRKHPTPTNGFVPSPSPKLNPKPIAQYVIPPNTTSSVFLTMMLISFFGLTAPASSKPNPETQLTNSGPPELESVLEVFCFQRPKVQKHLYFLCLGICFCMSWQIVTGYKLEYVHKNQPFSLAVQSWKNLLLFLHLCLNVTLNHCDSRNKVFVKECSLLSFIKSSCAQKRRFQVCFFWTLSSQKKLEATPSVNA